MPDIAERLRQCSKTMRQQKAATIDAYELDNAAAEIEKLRTDAARYNWLRSRDLGTISQGGVFAGMTPENVILNEEDLDRAIDAAMNSK